ncbi:hypothetical protein FRC04_009568 [Tulasnella sp. 424]|nr:hypothetical protein FRC04_009568 [Tulasnella sp. 424]KAG8974257.1 hypothetical protein FRC05_007681 [Tulasnella sp. 425]
MASYVSGLFSFGSKEPTPSDSNKRPTSNLSFDAGINASSAWTGARDTSVSDDEGGNKTLKGTKITAIKEEVADPPPRSARALYDFEGKPDFRELVIHAGDELSIIKENLAEGWSLAQYKEELGLIPRKYYIFTTDFVRPPPPTSEPPPPTTTSITEEPETPPATIPSQIMPLQPQLTGPYFASLRQTLLGGKSLNRFSNFVTCGAEDWVLNGVSPEDEDDGSASTGSEGVGDADKGQRHIRVVSEDDPNRVDETTKPLPVEKHYVDTPPAWRSKTAPFKVLIHSPSKHSNPLSGSYTMYCVTSLFQAHSPMHSRFSSASSGHVGESSSSTTLGPSISSRTVTQANAFDIPGKQISSPLYDDIDEESAGTVHVTVHRRFSHFVFLQTALSRRLPGIALPPLPDKQYAGRFNDEFVEARRGDLEKWLSRVVRHPLARNSEVVVFFLSCDNETEWRRNLPRFLAPPPSLGPAFYAHVYHQDFNFDSEEAEETVDRFENHLVGVGRGVQGVRGVFGRLREAHVGMSITTRALSYSLLSLITSTPAESSTLSPTSPTVSYPWETEDDGNDEGSGKKGLMNDEGAWCWRDDCEDCLKRTKAYQRTAETLQYIADAYDDHARRTQYATHDALKDVAHPSATYAGVIDTHRATLSRFDELNQNIDTADPDHARAARCETVLNTTMAEFDNYHAQKGEDFDRIAKEHLDGEIAFHEQILRRLRSARAAFEPPSATSPTGQTYFPASPPASATTPASAFTTMSGRQRSSSMSQYYSALPNGPRQPSIYERDLGTATVHRQPAPLPQPTAHIFDSGVVRPVSTAVNTIVGGIKGGAEGLKETGSAMGVGLPSLSMPGLGDITRGSVFDFGRLWSSGA